MFLINKKVRLPTYQAGLLQAKAHRALTNFMTSALASDAISLPEWALLGLLNEHHTLRPSELAEHLGVKPPVVTVHLKHLDALGLIHRHQPTQDSRVAEITLTTSGVERLEAIERHLRLELRGYLKDIKPADLVAYIRVLRKLADKLY